jgi:hypothetical protein
MEQSGRNGRATDQEEMPPSSLMRESHFDHTDGATFGVAQLKFG